jgi:regulator of sirC expression with transglutaminase-like and TPR domain
VRESEIKALVSLLDDDDEQVVSEVTSKIRTLGREIIPYLEQQWESNFNPKLQQKIENLIHDLQFNWLREQFIHWYRSSDQDLITGMWLVAVYQYPDLDIQKIRQELEQIYHEAWLEVKPDLNPFDQIKVLNGVFFGKLRFAANTKNFHSPGNSLINVVLETRKGNPISLCVVYMLTARWLGLPVYGVNLPNLFILTYKTDKIQFYINVFNRGLIFSRQDIENYIHELHLSPNPVYFEPCSNVDIVRRTLRNLVMSFDKIGEHARAEEVKELLLLIAEGDDVGL